MQTLSRNRVILPPLVARGPVLPPPPGWVETRLAGETMGTNWSLIAWAPPGAGPGLQLLVETECARVIALFSPWTPESEVSRLHRNGAGKAELSEDFLALLAPLLQLAAETGGASDPTLGALVDLWGFGPPGPRPALAPLPQPPEIAQARELSGHARLRLEGTRLYFPPGLRFDFSGSAKGHAVDLVSTRLAEAGIGSHLIEIGGEFYGRGLRPDMRPWWVGIEPPPEGLSNSQRSPVIALNGWGLASSGDYRRGFQHGGRRYAHTIDPATGWPVENDLASVSVLAPTVMQADALATAILVMGAARGMAFARISGVATVMIRRGPEGAVTEVSPALQEMLDDDPQR